MLTWIFYNTTVEMIGIPFRNSPLPSAPIAALEPFRIANQYGLFAVMTDGRYEIEFQGSNDGQNWTAYPFRYKPQALNEAPRIYAPYQPRFDWNLWFASLGDWRQDELVPLTEEQLLENDKDVLGTLSEAIRFRRRRRVMCAPFCGSIGSPRREEKRAHRKLVAPAVYGAVRSGAYQDA